MTTIKISELVQATELSGSDVLPIVNGGSTKKVAVSSLMVGFGDIPSLSANWNSTYSTVKSLSDTWEESVYITPLQVASASWDSVYSTVKSLSDTWEESVYITPLQVASASWDSVYSTVKSLSDTWEESVFITPLQVASASWDSVYSTVKSLSDTWEESVYITPLQVASASWDSVYSTVKSLSDTWEESVFITPLQVASASWDSVYSTTNSNSANWNNAYTNLINNSAAYLTGTDVNLGQIPTVSASWNSVYSTTNSNSAKWILDGGNTNGGNISIGTNDAYNLTLEINNNSKLLLTSDTLSGNSSNTSFGAGSATGLYSFAEGSGKAFGDYSHAEGQGAIASASSSHAEGLGTIASGSVSHVEGYYSYATAQASHAEGSGNTASGNASHAEGSFNTASGNASHAEGNNTKAKGSYSHAAGSYAEAAYDRTWIWRGSTETDVISTTRTDQFMVSAAGGVYIPGNVGIGTDNNSNALTVNGSITATSLNVFSLSSRSIDLLHTPANDGINPVFRIGELTSGSTTLSGFSGMFMSYNETSNIFGISAQFAPAFGVAAVSIDRNANVGIGTNAPNNKLTVAGNISAYEVYSSLAILSSSNSTGGLGPVYLRISNSSGDANNNGGAISIDQDAITYGRIRSYYDNTYAGWRMSIGPSLTPSIYMVNASGNVGINTAAPSEKLTVSGNISGNGNLTVTGNVFGGTNINLTNGSTYTIQLSDNGGTIASSNSTVGLTAVPSSSITYPTGFQTSIIQLSTARVALSSNSVGLSINQANGYIRTTKQYSAATLLYTGTLGGWVLFGDVGA